MAYKWGEDVVLVALLAGFVFAVIASMGNVVYVFALLSGAMFGRWLFKMGKWRVPALFVVVAFIVGVLLGSVNVNNLVVLALYSAGLIGCIVLHEKGILRSIEY
jgi:hypothetical protein